MCFYTLFCLIDVIISFHNTLRTFSLLACDIVVFLFDIFLNILFFVFSLPLDVTIPSHNTPSRQSRIFLEKILVMPWTTTTKVSPNKIFLPSDAFSGHLFSTHSTTNILQWIESIPCLWLKYFHFHFIHLKRYKKSVIHLSNMIYFFKGKNQWKALDQSFSIEIHPCKPKQHKWEYTKIMALICKIWVAFQGV